MGIMAERRGSPLPNSLDSSMPLASSFETPPSPDIRFVVEELWGQGEPGGEDVESLGALREPWEQDQELPWEQLGTSHHDTVNPILESATPFPQSAHTSDSHGASDPSSSEKHEGALPNRDAWSPPGSREEEWPLSGVSYHLQTDLWEPQEPLVGFSEEHSNPETCRMESMLQPGDAECHTSFDSAFSGSAQELSRRTSWSNASSLPGMSENFSTCPESRACLESHEASDSFRAEASPREETHGTASGVLGSCYSASPSSSVRMLDAPSPFGLEDHLLGDLDFSSPFSANDPSAMTSAEVAISAGLTAQGTETAGWQTLDKEGGGSTEHLEGLPVLGSQAGMNETSQGTISAENHMALPSEAGRPSFGACHQTPGASLGYTATVKPRSGSLAARLAGVLEGIAKDKKVSKERGTKNESDRKQDPVLHEVREPESAASPRAPGIGAPSAPPVEKRARVHSRSDQEAFPEASQDQNTATTSVLLPKTTNSRVRRKATAGPASVAERIRSSVRSRSGTKGAASNTKASVVSTRGNSSTDSTWAVLGSGQPGVIPGTALGHGTPLVQHLPGAQGGKVSPSSSLSSFPFIPLQPRIPGGGLKGQSSQFNDPQFQKAVLGQLMRLATAYSTGQEDLAHRWLIRLRKLASPRGHKLQRMVCYILAGLTQRFEGAGASPQLLPPPAATPPENPVEMARNGIRDVYGHFSEVAMTAHLVRSLVGHPRVHLVCFSTCLLPDWASLFAALASQGGGLKPHVRVSLIIMGPEVSLFKQLLSAYCSLSDEVVACGRAAGLETECAMVFAAPQDFNPSLVTVDPQECVAVTAWMSLQTLPDESVLRHNPRDAVLKWILGLRPVVFALVELDATYNSPFFLARFSEVLRMVGAAFADTRPRPEALAAGTPGPLEGKEGAAATAHEGEGAAPTIMELKKAADLMNCIAYEGLARYLRSESMALWCHRLQRLGFSQLRYTEGDLSRMRSEVLHLGLSVDDVGGLASVRREGNPMIFAGVWSAGI